MSKQAYSSYSSEDELDHLFAEQKDARIKDTSARKTEKKTMMENVMENLDKVLIGLAVLLLVVFFLHSQPHHKSKQAHKKVVNAAPEVSKKIPAEKAHNQLDKDKMDDILESYKAKMFQQSKKRQEPKDNFNLHKSANQHDDALDVSAKISEKYAESEKYSKHESRSELFNGKAQQSHFQSLKLARFNLETPKVDKQQKNISFNQQKRKLQQKYSIQQQFDQLSMCIVVYARLLKKDYAHQYVLQSVFNQDYNEYSVVYIADGHSEDQLGAIKQYLKEKDHNNRVTLIWNKERKYFLESTVNAVKSYCQKRSVTVLIDGNDELLGGQVFNLLNVFYRREGYNLLYGNFIEYYDSHKQFNIGFSSQYDQSQKQTNNYRLVPQRFGSIKTFKTRLLSFIKQSDFKDIYGNYYKQAGDYALIYPLLELSCGKVGYLPQYNYLYYGEEVDPATRKEQANNGMAIKAMEQYQCFSAYK